MATLNLTPDLLADVAGDAPTNGDLLRLAGYPRGSRINYVALLTLRRALLDRMTDDEIWAWLKGYGALVSTCKTQEEFDLVQWADCAVEMAYMTRGDDERQKPRALGDGGFGPVLAAIIAKVGGPSSMDGAQAERPFLESPLRGRMRRAAASND